MNSARQWLHKLYRRPNPTQVVRIDSTPSGVALESQPHPGRKNRFYALWRRLRGAGR